MFTLRGMLTFFAIMTVCHAQSINISGIVKDSSGAGLAGVAVKLLKANLSTTTVSDGSFVFGTPPVNAPEDMKPISGPATPFILERNTLALNCVRQTTVSLDVFDVRGALLHSQTSTVSAGKHFIPIPQRHAAGIRILLISLNDAHYTIRVTGLTSGGVHNGTGHSVAGNSPAKAARTMAKIDDIIEATKTGLSAYRMGIRNSDTTGILITLFPVPGTLADIEGNVYKTVRLGNQVWTAENLKTTKLNDGTAIANVTAGGTWSNLTTPAYCWYNNTTANRDKYGGLYNWYTANTGKLAPKGWHVPKDAEWEALVNYLVSTGYNYDGTTTDNKIAKSLATTSDWPTASGAGAIGNDLKKNNATGFSALPGGYRNHDGSFILQPNGGYWWSTTGTEFDSSYVYVRRLYYDFVGLDFPNYHKHSALAVRLLRD
jgi:uncharacterized protein (TIGR02145 family)